MAQKSRGKHLESPKICWIPTRIYTEIVIKIKMLYLILFFGNIPLGIRYKWFGERASLPNLGTAKPLIASAGSIISYIPFDTYDILNSVVILLDFLRNIL